MHMWCINVGRLCIILNPPCACAGGPAFTNRGECCGIAFQSLRVRPVAHAAHGCTDLHVNQKQNRWQLL